MELSDETLQQIREMAAALLPPAEIAILISLPAGERSYFCDICRNHHHSPIYEAYHQGRLQTKIRTPKNCDQVSQGRKSGGRTTC